MTINFISHDSLLSLISNGNKLIAENAHSVILTLLEYVQSSNYLYPMFEELNSKIPAVKIKIS